jgi:hypothetical protein
MIKVASRFLINTAFAAFEFLTAQNPRSAEGYLKFLDYTSGVLLSSAFLFKIFYVRWEQSQDWLVIALIFVIASKYFLSKISVTQELAIAKSLFSPNSLPDGLRLENRTSIAIRVFSFTLLYVVLGVVSDSVLFASLFMTVIAFADLRTRRLINKNIWQIFADEKYAPRVDEPGYVAILSRREIVRWYLFSLPHLWKEVGCVAGCATAFGIATYGSLKGTDLSVPAYATLIGTQITNEIITMRWRFGRYRRMKATLGLLDAIHDRTRDGENRVSTSDLAPGLELSEADIRVALQYLSEKGQIETFGKFDYASISASGTKTIENARVNPSQPQIIFGHLTYNNTVNIHHMEASSIQQGTSQSALVQSVDYGQQDLEDLHRALDLLEKHIDELGLEDAARRKALVQVATLKAQLTDQADPVILKQAGRTLRNITEGAIGGLITTAIQPSVWQFVGSVFARLFGA